MSMTIKDQHEIKGKRYMDMRLSELMSNDSVVSHHDHRFLVGFVMLIFLVFCVFCVVFIFVVCLILLVSLGFL